MKRLHKKIFPIALNILIGFFLVASSVSPFTATVVHGAATISDLVVTPYEKTVRISGKITSGAYDKSTLTIYVGEGLTEQEPPNEIGEGFFTTPGTGGRDTFVIGITGLQAGQPYHFYLGDGATERFGGGSGSFTLKGEGSGSGDYVPGVVSNLKSTISPDGKSAVVTGNITTGGYDRPSLVLEYGTGSTYDRSSPVMILSSESNKTDKFTATIPNLATAKVTYKFRIADDYEVTFKGGSGTFATQGSSGNDDATEGEITNLKAVVGSDGSSVVVTGSVTADSYDADSFVLKYGAGFSQGFQVPVPITSKSGDVDNFIVRINNIPPGTYNYGFSDSETTWFDGGTDGFVIPGSGTGGGGAVAGTTTKGGTTINGSGAGSGTFAPVVTFMGKVNRYIINPIIVLLFAGALVYFLFGVFQFVLHLDDPGEREIGKGHMIWGVIGMFIMFAVFAILKLIQNTLGADPLPGIQ